MPISEGDYCEDYEDPFDRSVEAIDRDDDEDDDEWECEFPGECLMPSILHTRDECYTVAMAEEYEREIMTETKVSLPSGSEPRA